jgi:hypothetical protein
MPQNVENPRIANATTDTKLHGEIVITEEMVKAGMEALSRHRACGLENPDVAVCAIFTAMVAVSPTLHNLVVADW